jgi:hypothetical protein
MAKKRKTTYCKTCKETVKIEGCDICNHSITDSCLDCHNELVHGVIEDQNIHVCGGRSSKLNTPDYDEDAFKRSDS